MTISFKQHLKERINPHLVHIEDSMYMNGYTGFRNSLCVIDNMLATLSGSSTSKVDITTKFDGTPAVFLGINPENGKFFVGTKSIFNKKSPKINYTDSDIRANYAGKGELINVLSMCLKYGKKLGIKSGIFQGDLMFTPDVLKKKKIDGESHMFFKPNTIGYAVPENSDMGREIKAAKIGIVFHTEYTGKDMQSLSTNYRINLNGKLRKTKDVYWSDAYFKDVSGTATFTASETKTLKNEMKEIKRIGAKLKSIMNTISKTSSTEAAMSQYINFVVRSSSGDSIAVSTSGFLDFVQNRMKTSDTNKERQTKFIHDNKSDLEDLFKLHQKVAGVKLRIVEKLATVKSMKHFISKGDDLVVSKPEGFVSIDQVGDAYKLVDRMEFSRSNCRV